MGKWLCSICLILSSITMKNSYAQGTFFPKVNPKITGTFLLDGYSEFSVPFGRTNTSDSLQLRWRKITWSATPGLITGLCDFGLCYDSIPGKGLMLSAPPGSDPFLKATVSNNGTPGELYAHLNVEDVHDPGIGIDVYFQLSTDGFTSISNPIDQITWIRKEGQLWILNPMTESILLRMYDVNGKLVDEQNVEPGWQEITELPNSGAAIHYIQCIFKNKLRTIPIYHFFTLKY